MAKKIGVSYFTLLLCAIAQARPHIPKNCTRQYTVNQGDTCDGISAHQQVSTYQLGSLNKKINPTCTNLVVGDVLCLGSDTKDCTTVQVVQQGDICAKIAQQAGIDVSDLLTNNPNINQDCTNIYVGEVLCVAPASNSTTPSLSGSSVLPIPPISGLDSSGAPTPAGIPLGLDIPANSGPSSLGLPLGLNNPANTGPGSPDVIPLGLDNPADNGPGSPNISPGTNNTTNGRPGLPGLSIGPNNTTNGRPGSPGLSIGPNDPPNGGPSSPGIPLGLTTPTDGGPSSAGIPLAPNVPTNTGPSSPGSGDNGAFPDSISLANPNFPDAKAGSNSNAPPPLNIPSAASGTPFSLTIPEPLDSSHGPSGPAAGGNTGNNAAQSPSLGSPGSIAIGPNAKTVHGAGLFPS